MPKQPNLPFRNDIGDEELARLISAFVVGTSVGQEFQRQAQNYSHPPGLPDDVRSSLIETGLKAVLQQEKIWVVPTPKPAAPVYTHGSIVRAAGGPPVAPEGFSWRPKRPVAARKLDPWDDGMESWELLKDVPMHFSNQHPWGTRVLSDDEETIATTTTEDARVGRTQQEQPSGWSLSGILKSNKAPGPSASPILQPMVKSPPMPDPRRDPYEDEPSLQRVDIHVENDGPTSDDSETAVLEFVEPPASHSWDPVPIPAKPKPKAKPKAKPVNSSEILRYATLPNQGEDQIQLSLTQCPSCLTEDVPGGKVFYYVQCDKSVPDGTFLGIFHSTWPRVKAHPNCYQNCYPKRFDRWADAARHYHSITGKRIRARYGGPQRDAFACAPHAGAGWQ